MCKTGSTSRKVVNIPNRLQPFLNVTLFNKACFGIQHDLYRLPQKAFCTFKKSDQSIEKNDSHQAIFLWILNLLYGYSTVIETHSFCFGSLQYCYKETDVPCLYPMNFQLQQMTLLYNFWYNRFEYQAIFFVPNSVPKVCYIVLQSILFYTDI